MGGLQKCEEGGGGERDIIFEQPLISIISPFIGPIGIDQRFKKYPLQSEQTKWCKSKFKIIEMQLKLFYPNVDHYRIQHDQLQINHHWSASETQFTDESEVYLGKNELFEGRQIFINYLQAHI